MDNYKGAVFFDFDGTLVDERIQMFYPSDKTIEASKLLKQNGYVVILATGRAKCYIPECGIDFSGYVASNGAYAELGGEIVHNNTIAPEKITDMLNYCKENGLGFLTENQERCYCFGENMDSFVKMIETFNLDSSCFMEMSDSAAAKDINKIMVTYNEPEQYDIFKKRFENDFLITRHRNTYSADVGKRGINKAEGVKAIIDRFGIPIENAYAFGDGENDVEMLGAVGTGIAMEIHSPALDGVAKYVTDSVKNEGIYNALKKFKLI